MEGLEVDSDAVMSEVMEGVPLDGGLRERDGVAEDPATADEVSTGAVSVLFASALADDTDDMACVTEVAAEAGVSCD